MTENDEQYFWDKVTQGRSIDDFFQLPGDRETCVGTMQVLLLALNHPL